MMEQPLNILLIEDNPGDAFLIKFYLEESVLRNSHITHAEYLKTATDLLSKNDYDLVILDFNLPDSVGIQTLETILKVKKDAVVIVLTGLQDEELGIQTVKMGAQDFLVKGQFDGKVFTQSIRYAFERSQVRKEIKRYADDLHRTEFRLDVVQKLTGSAFWRIIVEDKSAMVSQYFDELTGNKKNVETIADFLEVFDVNLRKQIDQAINDALNNKSKLSMDVKLRDGRTAKLEALNTYIDRVNIHVLAGILKVV
jgi:DNA-binding NarL/FixJ family response regulator